MRGFRLFCVRHFRGDSSRCRTHSPRGRIHAVVFTMRSFRARRSARNNPGLQPFAQFLRPCAMRHLTLSLFAKACFISVAGRHNLFMLPKATLSAIPCPSERENTFFRTREQCAGWLSKRSSCRWRLEQGLRRSANTLHNNRLRELARTQPGHGVAQTWAKSREERSTVPPVPSVNTSFKVYRFPALTPATRIILIIPAVQLD